MVVENSALIILGILDLSKQETRSSHLWWRIYLCILLYMLLRFDQLAEEEKG